MPSPFPGMDPYLEDERLWPAFHHHLMTTLWHVIGPNLGNAYQAQIRQRRYAAGQSAGNGPAERNEEYIEIRSADDSLVTLVEVVSPANKNTPEGREAYLSIRDQGRAVRANLVEIDLVLRGRPVIDYIRDGLPEWDFAVTVTRATQP